MHLLFARYFCRVALDIIISRVIIALTRQTVLDEGTEPWGVMVERVEVKDVRVPEQLQRAMAAEAEAARNARAKVTLKIPYLSCAF